MGVGGQAAKTAYKQALRVTIKNKMAGELNEQSIKRNSYSGLKAWVQLVISSDRLVEGADQYCYCRWSRCFTTTHKHRSRYTRQIQCVTSQMQ